MAVAKWRNIAHADSQNVRRCDSVMGHWSVEEY